MAIATRGNPVRNEDIEVYLPRSWIVDRNRSQIVAYKTCWTILCLSPRPHIKIEFILGLEATQADLQKIVEEGLKNPNLSSSGMLELRTNNGTIYCLESKDTSRHSHVVSTCLGPSSIISIFGGDPSELRTFYSIVSTIQRTED
jgi:hypothetical protein